MSDTEEKMVRNETEEKGEGEKKNTISYVFSFL
jgi:hypothetical protein